MWRESRSGELRIAHRPDLEVESVAQAIARHRENAAKGRDACEHWGPGSSVSRVVLEGDDAALDLAVKWNHWRGWRAGVSEALRGSRAARAARGADTKKQKILVYFVLILSIGLIYCLNIY